VTQASGWSRWAGRRGVKVGTAGVVLAASGLLASGATASAGVQAIHPSLSYACSFPSGSRVVTVQVAATFPASATAGQPIQPTGAQIALTLPHATVSYLNSLSAATVKLSAALRVNVSEGTTSATAAWQNFAAPAAHIRSGRGLPLTASGTVPSATVAADGNAAFTAANLSLLLTPDQASGQPTTPPNILIGCTLEHDQDGTLATIPVTGSATSHSGGISVGSQGGGARERSGTGDATEYSCPGLPAKGIANNPSLPQPPQPPKKHLTYNFPQGGCAYVAGFSDVKKLNEAALIGPGFADLWVGYVIYLVNPPNSCANHKPHSDCLRKQNYAQVDTAGELYDQGKHVFPPATATLLGFGFMPVTATLQLTEVGTLNAYAVGPEQAPDCPPKNIGCQTTITTLYSRVVLRVYNVKVNGVPLNVGPSCQTSPFVLTLVGKTPYYQVDAGGELTGSLTIPAFSGCGVGENLDSIFTASVSGSGNDVLLTQSPPCLESSGVCPAPPCKPIPQRTLNTNPVCPSGATSDAASAARQVRG
jgi:hypothetical protein